MEAAGFDPPISRSLLTNMIAAHLPSKPPRLTLSSLTIHTKWFTIPNSFSLLSLSLCYSLVFRIFHVIVLWFFFFFPLSLFPTNYSSFFSNLCLNFLAIGQFMTKRIHVHSWTLLSLVDQKMNKKQNRSFSFSKKDLKFFPWPFKWFFKLFLTFKFSEIKSKITGSDDIMLYIKICLKHHNQKLFIIAQK